MLNICIVFFVSGLWHGAAWTYVLWGLLHGIYQVIGNFTRKPREKMWTALHVDPKSKGVRMLKRFNTFLLVCFSWMMFRANSFDDLFTMIRKLCTDWQWNLEYFSKTLSDMGLTAIGIVISILSILIMNRMDAITLSDRDESGEVIPRKGLATARYVLIVWVVVIAWLMLLAGDGASSFIYFQF